MTAVQFIEQNKNAWRNWPEWFIPHQEKEMGLTTYREREGLPYIEIRKPFFKEIQKSISDAEMEEAFILFDFLLQDQLVKRVNRILPPIRNIRAGESIPEAPVLPPKEDQEIVNVFSPEHLDDFIIIKSRYNFFNKEALKGFEPPQSEFNKISFSLIQFLRVTEQLAKEHAEVSRSYFYYAKEWNWYEGFRSVVNTVVDINAKPGTSQRSPMVEYSLMYR